MLLDYYVYSFFGFDFFDRRLHRKFFKRGHLAPAQFRTQLFHQTVLLL